MSSKTDGKEENNVPKWVTSDLFVAPLKIAVPGYKVIKKFTANVGAGAGENYSTIMLSIQIDVETKDKKIETVALMMKIPHDSEMYREFIQKTNYFGTERENYGSVVPEFEQLYRDAGVHVRFGPTAYEINAPDEYVLLEDLRPKGFKNKNRLEGLDLEHTKSVLQKLAKWHAASAVRVNRKGLYKRYITKGFFCKENKEWMERLSVATQKTIFDCMLKYEGHESYMEDVKFMQSKVVDEVIKMAETDPNEFNVLNHGDVWSNNIMFQYDEHGNIKETFFIDYQMTQYGSVAQDLLYFLLSSPALDIKISKFEYLIKYYHDNLIENLKLLKYPKKLPTLKDIHAVLHKYGAWGYFALTTIMAIVLLDPTKDAGFDSFFDSLEFKTLMYSNPRYRKHMEVILPWLQYRGAFE